MKAGKIVFRIVDAANPDGNLLQNITTALREARQQGMRDAAEIARSNDFHEAAMHKAVFRERIAQAIERAAEEVKS